MTPEEQRREFLWMTTLMLVGILCIAMWLWGMHCGVESLCKTICHSQGFAEGDGELNDCTCTTTTTTVETKTIPEKP